jgi:hypothetical protein
MKHSHFIFSLALSFISTLCVQANESISRSILSNNLEQLRKEYHSARDALAEINSTRKQAAKRDRNLSNDQKRANSQERSKVWHPAFLKCKSSYEQYIFSLVKAFATMPTGNPELKDIQGELLQQHPKNSLTESYVNQLSLLANAIHPHLINESLENDRADFFVQITKPTGSIKFEDTLNLIGISSEPQGWNIQATYSLSHLRAGNISAARKENEKLIRKSKKLSKNGIGLNYRKEGDVRSYKSLHREFLLHRALIEAVASKNTDAKENLAKAQSMDEKEEIKNEQQPIVQEIESLLGA